VLVREAGVMVSLGCMLVGGFMFALGMMLGCCVVGLRCVLVMLGCLLVRFVCHGFHL
jgi:hypothetical protein